MGPMNTECRKGHGPENYHRLSSGRVQCRVCVSEQKHASYLRNRERTLEQHKRYYEANIDKARARRKALYAAHREEAKRSALEWYYANHERAKAARKAYREAHAEDYRESKRRYYLAHKDEIQEKQRAYVAAHREETKARQDRWRRENADRLFLKGREYRHANRDELRQAKETVTLAGETIVINTLPPELQEVARLLKQARQVIRSTRGEQTP